MLCFNDTPCNDFSEVNVYFHLIMLYMRTVFCMFTVTSCVQADNEDDLFESILHDDVLYPVWLSKVIT